MAQILPEEAGFLDNLHHQGVLEDIDERRVDASHGVILITCADGDQMADIFQHTEKLSHRLHTLALNGGGLLLPEESPANDILTPENCAQKVRIGDVFLKQIIAARALKRIDLIALHVHFPCGIARLYNISPSQLINLLLSAKNRLKHALPGIKVCAFVHIVWPDGRKRTYFVSREKWNAYNETHESG